MSQKKVTVKVSSPRRPSEASSKSSAAKTTASGKPYLHGPSDNHSHHSHHRRESVGHRLMLPIEVGSRRRSYSWQGHPIEPRVQLEPTYQLKPTEKISISGIEKMMKQEIGDLLHGLDYNVIEAPNWSKVLSERLKTEAKKLLPNRYKLVAIVVIAPRAHQSIQSSSRCLWEPEYDTVINSLYESKNLLVSASIYCVYTP